MPVLAGIPPVPAVGAGAGVHRRPAAQPLQPGALYYELHQDFGQALALYDRGGDHRKVSELLRRSAELHPGMGHYEELAVYYDTLSDEEIAASPSLMQAVSMLCALRGGL